MKKNLAIALIALGLFSCKTNPVYLTVTEPAPVSIPGHIKKVGIINRSILSDENKILNTIDQVLSEKGSELDKEGAKESIRGVTDALLQNNRFSQVIFLDKVDFKSARAGVFSSPLSWDVIEKTCRENNLDALFVLELFDTDSKISYSTTPVKVKTPLGDIPAIEHHAQMVTLVRTGWRIYDPKIKTILDEFPVSESLVFNGSGINPVVAAAALMNRKEAVKQTGYKGGQSYAYRILPYSIRVSREYYVKGNDNFKIAKRMARVGNWNDAAELWKKEITNPSTKIMGRACYNMAIINEINGDLDAAIDWAQKAYVYSNKRLAMNYVNILKNRKSRNIRLQNQLEEAH